MEVESWERERADVLMVSDDALSGWPLRHGLEEAGYRVAVAGGMDAALAQAAQANVVVLSLAQPTCAARELIARLADRAPDAPVIVLVEAPTVRGAVEAMRHGAYHYARHDLSPAKLAGIVASALDDTRLSRDVRSFVRSCGGEGTLLGSSPTLREVRRALNKIAASPSSTVLITGESGTGKSLAARMIHLPRMQHPFVNITCSALPEHLLESELFGHERGAFTDAKQRKLGLFEVADGGTVFLDEIGEMSLKLQAKLLRFLEERSFRRVGGSTDIRPDVRVIAATNRDLEEDVREGRFRADLYFRLAVIRIRLPPLREREGDVSALAQYFLLRAGRSQESPPRQISPEALARLERHTWPGNVRELRNTIERVVILSSKPRIEASDLPSLEQAERTPSVLVLPPEALSIKTLERELVVQALERSGGNQTRAADLLGMTRDQIRYRIAKFKLAEAG